MITLKNVSKFYYNKGIIASGITKINLELSIGEFVAITGESGSGKSTLLNVISGLDSYEEGEMYINGVETSHYTKTDFEEYRRQHISNIFQNFNLVNSYTVWQNIELVMLLKGKKRSQVKKQINNLIAMVGLTPYKNTKVSKLSGGQKQRVAIARALAKDTDIIIADEPTGNLDSTSAKEIIEILSRISNNKLVIIVTHNYDQVENYVTRKIRMHDGKIIEDKQLKPTNIIKSDNSSTKSYPIRLSTKWRLGIRNAFNIIPKFLLVFSVYIFIILAVTSEYAFFKKQESLAAQIGYNNFFTDTSVNRIIIKKTNLTPFTDDDYQKITTIPHVESLTKNDLLLDTTLNLTDDENFYSSASIYDIDKFQGKVDIGTIPQNPNEILFVCSKNNYYFEDLNIDFLNKEVYLEDITGTLSKDNPLKIVGISYIASDDYYSNTSIYATSSFIDNIQVNINKQYSTLKVLFNDEYHDSNNYDIHYQVIPSSQVPQGKVYLTADLNSTCKNNNCLNYPLTLEVTNPYYTDKLELQVGATYEKKNFEKLLNLKEIDEYNGAIFVNNTDYDNLFNKPFYQSSIFVDNVENLDLVANELTNSGYTTLKIKDTLITSGTSEIFKILRTIVTIVVVITLFFISYFVIRIILKSRNTYFAIIRILGGTKSSAKEILIIELLTISNLACFTFAIFLLLDATNYLKNSLLDTIFLYLKLPDYLILYLIINLMSYLISVRFARKIFQTTAMNLIREKV